MVRATVKNGKFERMGKMKKEDLIAMGLSEDQAKKVMDSLDGDFVAPGRFI